jgi:predicted HAD superfamily hydrolase
MIIATVKPKAKVAVITRTKNRPIFLRRAIKSVLSQVLEDWLHVIVNDGGDPATVDFLVRCEANAYKGRVLVVHHTQSQGMQCASNAGIMACDSKYLVIHDDDDSWNAEFLSKTVRALENENKSSIVRAVATQSTQVLEEVLLDGNIVETARQKYAPFNSATLEAFMKCNLFPPIAFVYFRDIHEEVGLYRQEFDVLGDYDFNLRLAKRFNIQVLDEELANYHWRHRSFGNTVTRGRSKHRFMLKKLKDAYEQDVLNRSPQAIGSLNKVPIPPQAQPANIPFKLRSTEPQFDSRLPDFEASYNFEVLSLDIFDTVLFRRTYRPTDVFNLLEQKAVEQLALPPGPYALARKKAEENARETAKGGEVNIGQIYQIFGELLELNADQRSILQALEWSLEKEVLYADPRWLELYQQYQKKEKRVIFISDMYWPKNYLVNLLSDFGFKDPEIFVSCDYGLSKHDGTLQCRVVEELRLTPSNVLHVGDNFRSDVAQSRQLGMRAFHWCKPYVYEPLVEQVELPPPLDEDPFSLRLIGEARHMGLAKPLESSPDPFMERLGRELAGPLYYCFLSWLVQIARKDRIRKLVFVGRDGYYWEKTMQFLDKKYNLGFEFTYLHASRKVFAFASFRKLDARAMKFLSVPNPSLRVRDFIDRTGLDSTRYLDFIQSVGFSSLNEMLTSEHGGSFLRQDYESRLSRLFWLIEVDLLESFERCREGLLQSLDEQSFDIADSAIVDIGWQGSSAHALAHLLDLHETESLKAYFFGTWPRIEEISPTVCSRSFFMHAGEPQELGNLVSESVSILEALHNAPFTTMIDYVFEEQKGYLPVYSSCSNSGLGKAEQEYVWNGVELFLETVSYNEFPQPSKHAGVNYLERVLHRLLREPSPSERNRLGKLLHSEGFGLEINKPLIAQVDKKLKPEDVMKQYRESNWKRGFLAGLDKDTRSLVLAHLKGGKNSHYDEPKNTPWHKYIYRFYRRMLGAPKYTK